MIDVMLEKKSSTQKISVNFRWSELKCKCEWEDCNFTIITKNALGALEKTREEYKKPIIINSAFRCNRHNEIIGGAENSNHKHGDAFDITPKDPRDLHLLHEIASKYFYTILYDTFIHCDKRANQL